MHGGGTGDGDARMVHWGPLCKTQLWAMCCVLLFKLTHKHDSQIIGTLHSPGWGGGSHRNKENYHSEYSISRRNIRAGASNVHAHGLFLKLIVMKTKKLSQCHEYFQIGHLNQKLDDCDGSVSCCCCCRASQLKSEIWQLSLVATIRE